MTKDSQFFPDELTVAWSTKDDGPMNIVGHKEFDEERRANRAEFLSHAFQRNAAVLPRLQHGNGVNVVVNPTPQDGMVICDGLVTDRPGLVLTVGFADCPPVFFYDPKKKVIGLAHSGWRGTVGGVIDRVVSAMRQEFNCYRDDIEVLIGPGICMEHYEVGADVGSKFGYLMRPDGKMQLNLKHEIEQRLIHMCRIYDTHIRAVLDCTYHNLSPHDATKYRYFSGRRDKIHNPLSTGIAAIMIK